jgi:hypothetical protein
MPDVWIGGARAGVLGIVDSVRRDKARVASKRFSAVTQQRGSVA